MSSDLLSLSVENQNDKRLERSDCLQEDQNPLDFYSFNSKETIMISNSPTSVELRITPGEGKHQNSILNDKFSEELVFPYLFSNGKFGYKVEREINLNLLIKELKILISDSLILHKCFHLTLYLTLGTFCIVCDE